MKTLKHENTRLDFAKRLKTLKQSKRGVTLIETLVALTILVAGVFAGMSLMISTLSLSQRSEQTITVVSLAREGIEMVRSMRDNDPEYFFGLVADGNYVLDSQNWDDLEHLADNSQISECGNCRLYLSDGRYIHSSGSPTAFRRLISVETDAINSWNRKVVSKIMWSEHGRQHVFILEDHLTDWRTY